ncbi:MAG: dynamin family protein [Hasllibacter sp.]
MSAMPPNDGPEGAGAPARRPRVALMGEFSAGKSTLTNLLLGARALPEKVTATQLPPVWIASGEGGPVRVHADGGRTPLDASEIGAVPAADTLAIRMFHRSWILDLCDLIDFPGISDPNMDSEVWERLLPEVDMVLWLTHATQAWRRSEAAAWRMVPEAVRRRSLLLVTRFDKLTTPGDRQRVLRRVGAEAGAEFAAVLPVALPLALEAATLVESGYPAVTEHLERALRGGIADGAPRDAGADAGPADPPPAGPQAAPRSPAGAEGAAARPAAARIVPRRVRRRDGEAAPQVGAV